MLLAITAVCHVACWILDPGPENQLATRCLGRGGPCGTRPRRSRLAGDTLLAGIVATVFTREIPANSSGDSKEQRTIAINPRVYALYMHVQAHAHADVQSCGEYQDHRRACRQILFFVT